MTQIPNKSVIQNPLYILIYILYSVDLNSEHLNNGNNWITNFYLSSIQMSGIPVAFKYKTIWRPDNFQPY